MDEDTQEDEEAMVEVEAVEEVEEEVASTNLLLSVTNVTKRDIFNMSALKMTKG